MNEFFGRFDQQQPSPIDPTEMLQERLYNLLNEQPWWRENSNTVTTAVAGATGLVWWVTSTGLQIPETAQWAIGIVLFIAQVLGVKHTKNGIAPSTIDMIMDEAVQAPGDTHWHSR